VAGPRASAVDSEQRAVAGPPWRGRVQPSEATSYGWVRGSLWQAWLDDGVVGASWPRRPRLGRLWWAAWGSPELWTCSRGVRRGDRALREDYIGMLERVTGVGARSG
jgi:hypothetical protein